MKSLLALIQCAIFVLFSATAVHAQNQTNYMLLKQFGNGDRLNTPSSKLVQGINGIFYGLAENGGNPTLYSINADGSGFQAIATLPVFSFSPLPLFAATDGSVYIFGTDILRYLPAGNTLTTIRSAAGFRHSALIEGTDGMLYGAVNSNTSSGIFRMAKDGSDYTLLANFSTAGIGEPRNVSAILLGSDLKLYAAAQTGGSSNLGMLFRLNSDGTFYEPLHTFTQTNQAMWPTGLMQAGDGNLYGVGWTSVSNEFFGLVFKFSAAGDLDVIHRFAGSGDKTLGPNDHVGPASNLIEGPDGLLYSTFHQGGLYGGGGIYKLSKEGTIYQVIKNFSGLPGDTSHPLSGVTFGTNGKLFAGGHFSPNAAFGSIFAINSDGTGFEILKNFNHYGADSRMPYGEPVLANDGLLYGTASRGGTNNCGTVFRIDKHGGSYEILHHFNFSKTDGALPLAALIEGANGRLYGTTTKGGSNHFGTIFAMDKNGSNYQVLKHFAVSPSDGKRPKTKLLQGTDGFLYGTTASGGSNNLGVIYKIASDGTSYSVIHHFSGLTGSMSEANDLIESADGFLYGSFRTYGGHAQIFRINKDGSNFTILLPNEEYTWAGTEFSGLVQDSEGWLYAAQSNPALLKLDTNGTQIGYLGREEDYFMQPNSISISSNGTLFGTTLGWGNAGIVFYYDELDNRLVSLHDLHRYDGGGHTPFSPILAAADEGLYGTLRYGGTLDEGVLYKLYSTDSPAAPRPTITEQPARRRLDAGTTVRFLVAAESPGVLSYQWFFNGVPISDATNTSVLISNIQQENAGDYTVVVSGLYGSTTSQIAALTVDAAVPDIVVQPNSQIRPIGGTVNISASARGTEPLTYIWTRISPASPPLEFITTSRFLAIDDVESSLTGTYQLAVSNSVGTTVSQPFDILIGAAIITRQPRNLTIYERANAKFTVAATGIAPLAFQWFENGSPLSGATNTSHTVRDAQSPADFFVTVQNELGSVTSRVATLTLDTRFVDSAGTYHGLFYETNEVRHESSGFITLVTKSTAHFNGQVILAGETNSFSGKLTPEGIGQATINHSANQLNLEFQLASESSQHSIQGGLSSPTWNATLLAHKSPFNSTNPTPFAGAYNIALPGDYGHGYILVNLDSNGLINAAGNLAGGTPISQSVALASQWPFFASLETGALLGWLTFQPIPVPHISGTVHWIQLASPGFTNQIEILSSPWQTPSAQTPLSYTDGLLILNSPTFTSTNGLRFRSNNTIAVKNPNPHQLTLSFDRHTGELTGSFTDPFSGTTNRLAAAFLQFQNQAAGHFLTPTNTGQVLIIAE